MLEDIQDRWRWLLHGAESTRTVPKKIILHNNIYCENFTLSTHQIIKYYLIYIFYTKTTANNCSFWTSYALHVDDTTLGLPQEL